VWTLTYIFRIVRKLNVPAPGTDDDEPIIVGPLEKWHDLSKKKVDTSRKQAPSTTRTSQKAQADEPVGSKRKDCLSSGDDTDDENSFGRRLQAARQRGKKQNETERRAMLEADENACSVEPHRVQCGACLSWIKLHPKRTYTHHNWKQHVQVCPNITGIKQRRVALIKKSKPVGPVSRFQSCE
jgi:hypothetical protein